MCIILRTMFGRNVTILMYMCVLTLEPSQAAVRYDGHKILHVTPKSPDQFPVVLQAQRIAHNQGLDIWRDWTGVGGGLDIRVSPSEYGAVIRDLDELKLKHDVLIEDVQKTIDSQAPTNGYLEPKSKFDYGQYHRLEQIDAWLEDIHETHQQITELVDVSKTFEGRTIRGLKIDTKVNNSMSGIWIQSGLHAREWIGPAVVMYMTHKLLDEYAISPRITDVVDSFKWFIVPVVNKDGYVYTWDANRLWRKTRSTRPGSGDCVGVDPNRNWSFKWGGEGSSSNPCSDQYRGPEAFSEPCVDGVATYIKECGIHFKGFLDVHSYSQMWMSPWGYTRDLPEDYTDQDASSRAATDAIREVHGTEFTHGSIGNVIYLASGNCVDWSYSSREIQYSVAVELRDNGTYGFLLPADQIVPTGQESLQGLLAYAQYVAQN